MDKVNRLCLSSDALSYATISQLMETSNRYKSICDDLSERIKDWKTPIEFIIIDLAANMMNLATVIASHVYNSFDDNLELIETLSDEMEMSIKLNFIDTLRPTIPSSNFYVNGDDDAVIVVNYSIVSVNTLHTIMCEIRGLLRQLKQCTVEH